VVGAGYYVRSLARDLGRDLGCGAHLGSLRRTAIGPWSDPGPGREVALHGNEILPWLPTRILTDHEVGDLRQGRTIPVGDEPGAPEWNAPPGFPAPRACVRGFHLGRLTFLLQRARDCLQVVAEFPGGL
jgi:tRNA pseudouridine55 synthase